MLRGATWRAAAIVGTAVFRIVASSDSMKKATATSQGNSRLTVVGGAGRDMALSYFVKLKMSPTRFFSARAEKAHRLASCAARSAWSASRTPPPATDGPYIYPTSSWDQLRCRQDPANRSKIHILLKVQQAR